MTTGFLSLWRRQVAVQRFLTLARPMRNRAIDVVPRTSFQATIRPRPSQFASFATLPTSDEKTIEERYSRKTPLEHVLLRPSMYIGSTERSPESPYWTLTSSIPKPPTVNGSDDDALEQVLSIATPPTLKAPLSMQLQDCSVVPALLKVVDEILVNASDHRLRNKGKCTRIDVYIHPGNSKVPPLISVQNNGPGIPIKWHEKEQMYVPTLLFGHLMTGSNFDDNEKRITGGRHGYGAKLSNIFSLGFTVETVDRGTMFRQKWWNNMHEYREPEVSTAGRTVKDTTRISFVPDVAKLTQTSGKDAVLSKVDYKLLCKRVIDIAGCGAGEVQVTLNGYDVSFSSFDEYLSLYRQRADSTPLHTFKLNDRWEISVGTSQSGKFESVSFVNGMCTTRGGTHIDAITKQIVHYIKERAEKSDSELAKVITAHMVRECMFVAVKALIENPTFDSQMKECLTSNPNQFGSSYTISQAALKKIALSAQDGGPGIIDEVIQSAHGRQQSMLSRLAKNMQRGKRNLLAVPKLEDAHQAGGPRSTDCTLILTEGDSAKSLAVAGLEVVGRDRYGVFPLRGKMLNVRSANLEKLEKNAEVKALLSILGLDFDKQYDTAKDRMSLRYGRVMIMADQDTDGSHIKGLIINFFRAFWPKLLIPLADGSDPKNEAHPFISSFVTPLLKATRKGTDKTISFYSVSEFNKWQSKLNPNKRKHWRIKYYKGLGTSTPAEAKAYFKDFDKHHRSFVWKSDKDGEMLDMVFDKERASDRRTWILDTHDYNVEPSSKPSVCYEDFVNRELIHFSNSDNIRSIPSVIDGLKPSQRKVLYACFKRNLKHEIKVAQLSGFCAEHTAYHHGEASLQSTIVGMAQDFVGSNNINLLVPSGQFGTRLVGGTDAASPRYIFTHLDPIARLLFPESDDALLEYLEDDGEKIEPKYYCPIAPLLLINGAKGIGTGWSTSIPSYKPIEVVDYLRGKLDNAEELPELRPYARGFKGKMLLSDDGRSFISQGRIKRIGNNKLLIDELPIGVWTETYKEQLLRMRSTGKINNFVENHTIADVSFTVKLNPSTIIRMQRIGLEKAFRLQVNMNTTNMHAFDAKGQIKKYERAEDIIEDFYPVRLDLYADRKSALEAEMKYAHAISDNKSKFIQRVTAGEINLLSGNTNKTSAVKQLHELGLEPFSQIQTLRRDCDALVESGDTTSTTATSISDESVRTSDYDYLLNMPLSTLTSEKVDELLRESKKREKELKQVEKTTPVDMWRSDLDRLAKALT